MSVFSKIRGFLTRHRTKFFVSGVIITGSILLTRYAQQRLKEWQERETRDFMERTRKKQHFESTERTCNQTILSIVSTLNESLNKIIDTEAIIVELRNNPPNKIELWDTLKVLVLTKASCLIYLSVMLVLTLRIQLNIVGGYLFKDQNSVSTELQQKYLLLSHNLLESGVKRMSVLLKSKCSDIMEPLVLKKQIKLNDFDGIFWAIQSTVATNDENPIEHFSDYIIDEPISDDNDTYSNMIRDTADLLESDEVKSLAAHCINRGFVLLEDQLSEYYGNTSEKIKEVPADTPINGFVHPFQKQIPLAKLIPIINGLISKGSVPDQLITQLIVNDRIKTLGANVYECFSHVK